MTMRTADGSSELIDRTTLDDFFAYIARCDFEQQGCGTEGRVKIEVLDDDEGFLDTPGSSHTSSTKCRHALGSCSATVHHHSNP